MPRDRRVMEWMEEAARLRKMLKSNNVQQDRYDATIWKELKNSPEIGALESQGAGTFPALLQDLWATFYKAAPELENEKDVHTAHRVNRPFVEKLLDDQQTKEARVTTMLDELASAVATVRAGRKILDEINENMNLKNAMQRARYALDESGSGDGKGAQQSTAQALEDLKASATQVRAAIKKAVKAGQEEAEKVEQAMSGWGMEPEELNALPIGDRLKLASTVTDGNLKRIADLVGKMRNLARAKQRSKVKQRRDEIHSITVGDDLPRALPQELASLMNPLRRLDFYRRFTEGQLLQYALRGEEKLARGPIVAMIDASGSMCGSKIEWAVASALALADTAIRQKRHCYVYFFNTEIQAEFKFEPGKKDINEYLRMAQMGCGGGTNYWPPINKACGLIANTKAYKNADMIMVTDGLCELSERDILALTGWKAENKVSCYTILIGSSGPSDGLKSWNEKVWKMSSVAASGEDVAESLFEEI